MIYARETDEAAPKQAVSRRSVEQMNQMMQLVVTEGTGKKATLDFTHSVGKTGTSSSYRDAWFVGFTGSLVTGVWFGNDDNRAMRFGNGGVTGGSIPAETWQRYMAVAHSSMNIPTIFGLTPHPRQVQEADRLAQLRRTDPALAAAQAQVGQRTNKIMPDKTREVLKRLSETLRKTAGIETPTPPVPARQGALTPERRADAQGTVAQSTDRADTAKQ